MTKEQLQEYKWIQKNIKNLTETLEELRSQAECKSPVLSDEPKGSYQSFDQIPRLVSNIVEVEENLIEKLKQSYELLGKIEDCISILNEKEKHLLRLRYVNCMPWKDICINMSYSRRQVNRIHSKALVKISTL